MIGSPFLSQCAHDARAKRCQELGDAIKFHINGNALYAVGDKAFRSYWSRAFAGQLSLWPFDLSLHIYAQSLPEAAQRRLASKFRVHPFILNFGAEPLTTAAAATAAAAASSGGGIAEHDAGLATPIAGPVPMLRHTSPFSYLLHSSWAMGKLRADGVAGYATLGLNAPGGAAQPTIASSSRSSSSSSTTTTNDAPFTATSQPASTLLSLARSLADEHGRIILTFATALYDPLCRNFVGHLRRLDVRNYLLATFTAAYHRTLVARGERAYLHELPGLTSDGSDVFASRDFFLINSARYTVLTMLLRAGLHVFSVDLDVVLLQDPIPHVWQLPYDLLLQSDARDATTLAESSPFLLRDRLHMSNASGVTYINGGVFFARGTHAVARLFEDTWAMASQDLGTLNEQDCLNRMLIASSLRWAPLPPHLFPNGYVYFRRPIAASMSSAHIGPIADQPLLQMPLAAPVLVHCNWINGIPAKRFLLREAMIWGDRSPADYPGARVVGGVGGDGSSGDGGGSHLAYMLGPEQATLGAQVRALVSAIALSVASNRTLVLPSFSVVPSLQSRRVPLGGAHLNASTHRSLAQRAAAASAEAQNAGRRVFTFLFEYVPLLRHFPNHRESSLLRTRWPHGLPSASPVPLDGADSIARWLLEQRANPLLYVWGLERTPLQAIFPASSDEKAFRSRLRSALQPAPELRVISHHIISKIHSHLSSLHSSRAHSHGGSEGRHRGSSRRPQGSKVGGRKSGKGGGGSRGRKLLTGTWRDVDEFLGDNGGGLDERPSNDFNCLHVSEGDLSSPGRLMTAAGTLPLDAPTLIVREVGLGGLSAGVTGRREGDRVSGALPAVLPSTAVSRVFSTAALEIRDFYPYWDEVEVLDASGLPTLAYDLVQQLVCAAGRRVQGSPHSEFVHGVCHWRRSSSVMSKLLAGSVAGRKGVEVGSVNDACSTISEFA